MDSTQKSRTSAGTARRLTWVDQANVGNRLVFLRAWCARRPRLSTFLAGAVSSLSMAPVFMFPVLFLTFFHLIDALDRAAPVRETVHGTVENNRARARRFFTVGWWFGFGYFVLGLYWLSASLLVEPEKFAWLLPLSATLIPAGLAIFHGLATAIASFFWRPGLARCLALALGFGLAEWLRGHVLTGFPWNAIGYALTAPGALMPLAAVFGVGGLTVLAVLVFSLGTVAVQRNGPGTPHARFENRLARAALLGFAGLCLVFSPLVASQAPSPFVPDVQLRLLQPNISQQDKWRFINREKIFADYLSASRKNRDGRVDDLAGITHVIWPESAIPFLLLQNQPALAAISAMLPPGSVLITGAVRLQDPQPGDPSQTRRRIYNSLLSIDDSGSLIGIYDKVHLVPFGEYLPLQGVLETVGIRQLTGIPGGFDTGRADATALEIPGLPPMRPLICYEVIFPDEVATPGKRPAFLLNVTNDGWFGATAGPYQHLHQAQVRAVEQGLPLIRVANTGISAVIDARGRIVSQLALNSSGVIDTGLPSALPATPYARLGDRVLFALLAAVMASWWALRRRTRL